VLDVYKVTGAKQRFVLAGGIPREVADKSNFTWILRRKINAIKRLEADKEQ
jgi:hypothetical protein